MFTIYKLENKYLNAFHWQYHVIAVLERHFPILIFCDSVNKKYFSIEHALNYLWNNKVSHLFMNIKKNLQLYPMWEKLM